MALESTFDFPDDLNTANPANGDDIDEGAAHLRGIKSVVQNFARDFDGNPLSESILSALFPPGVALIATGDSPTADPGNQIGGTWTKHGTGDGSMTLDDGTTKVYVWYRVA
jgi:hypothetical protein